MAGECEAAQGRDRRRAGGAARRSPPGRRGRVGAAVRTGLFPQRRARGSGGARPARPLRRRARAVALRPGARARPAKVRVYNPKVEQHGWQSTHTVIEIVNDDMPFLVDSLTSSSTGRRLGIHLIIHPVLRGRRDARGPAAATWAPPPRRRSHASKSYMHVEIDRQSDPSGSPRWKRTSRRVLGDVRAAVADWRAMHAKIEEVAGRDRCRRFRGAGPRAGRRRARSCAGWPTTISPCSATAPTTARGNATASSCRRVAGAALGILRARRAAARSRASFAALPAEIRGRARRPLPVLTITKANTRSTVHRASLSGLRRRQALRAPTAR